MFDYDENIEISQYLIDKYQKEQDSFNFQLGEKVIVKRKIYPGERLSRGWNPCWPRNMDNFIGKIATITSVYKNGPGLRLQNENGETWSFPYFVVERINEKPKEKDIEREEIVVGGEKFLLPKCIISKIIG